MRIGIGLPNPFRAPRAPRLSYFAFCSGAQEGAGLSALSRPARRMTLPVSNEESL